MAYARPVMAPYDRTAVLIEPGGEERRGARGSVIRGADIEHTGMRCNLRPTRASETLESGDLVVSETEATALFRWSPLMESVTSDWHARIDGREYELIGPPDFIGRRTRQVRLRLRRRAL